MDPLPGAREFLDWARERLQVLILSDTFYQFATPLMRKLGWPTLFCHFLDVDANGRVTGYRLRQKDAKREAVRALHGLHFRAIAAGDSYNDTTMLGEADAGILFCPPDNVVREFPHFPVARSYDELRARDRGRAGEARLMAARFGLTEAERRAWREDGFFVRRAVFDAAELEVLRDAAERVRAIAVRLASRGTRPTRSTATATSTPMTSRCSSNTGPGRRRCAWSNRSAHSTRSSSGSSTTRASSSRCAIWSARERVGLWTDKLNFKPPHEGSGFRWHQDSPVLGPRLPPPRPAPERDAGARRCRRGERLPARGARLHRHGLLPGRQEEACSVPSSRIRATSTRRRRWRPRCPPASCSSSAPHTVHGSEPNRSERVRRAMVLTYQPAGHDQFKAPGPARDGIRSRCPRREPEAEAR